MPGFTTTYLVDFSLVMFNKLGRELIVRFVDIAGIVDHRYRCLELLTIGVAV